MADTPVLFCARRVKDQTWLVETLDTSLDACMRRARNAQLLEDAHPPTQYEICRVKIVDYETALPK